MTAIVDKILMFFLYKSREITPYSGLKYYAGMLK